MKAITLPLLVLLSSVLAGCTSEPQARVVDFSAVDETQPGAGFELKVKVVGLKDGSQPLSGAFVGAAEGAQAVAKGTTDGNGIAVLRVQSGQTIRVVASAPGWTTEDSGRLSIGRTSDASDSLPSAGCTGGAAQDREGQAAGGWCMVTAGESDESTVNLQGDRGSVSVVLFPRVVQQLMEKEIGPNLNARFTTLPDGNEWIPFSHTLNEDASLHELQMLRFESATTKMRWNNDMLSEADFELGAGCDEAAPMEQTDDIVPSVQRQTYHLELEFESENEGRWSGCPTYYVGPIVSTVNTPVTVHLESVMTFRGRSTIIPIGE